MIQLGRTIISEEILDQDFVCNLSACKGACCIEGDAGAPVEDEERAILDEIYPKVKPYMTESGIKSVEEQGTYVKGEDGDWETPLVNGAECAYVVINDKGMALCAIEQAYNDGKINWKKPISCHLYPIRLQEYSTFTAVNYNRWGICSDACTLGKELKVPVYKFTREALIRKFGEEWYQELEKEAQNMMKLRNKSKNLREKSYLQKQ